MDLANYGKNLLQMVLASSECTPTKHIYYNSGRIFKNTIIEDYKADIHHLVIEAAFQNSDEYTYKKLLDYVLKRHPKKNLPIVKNLSSKIVKQFINCNLNHFNTFKDSYYDYSESCTSDDDYDV